jgi:tetratricopeptide (TPR) repeat protein
MSAQQQQPGRAAANDQLRSASSSADQILGRTQSSRAVIQELVPLAQSLEWDLGQTYLRERGSSSFVADSSPVPWIVNNDGTLSRRAAEVFFESLERSGISCQQSDKSGIYVLELGVGVGLFARFFLDHFRELSRKHNRDYYDRLCYVLADRSPRMLLDVARHGILAGHPGRYRLRVADAMKPEECLPYDVAFSGQFSAVSDEGTGDREQGTGQKKRFRAAFLNYLLDCLPAAVLEVSDQQSAVSSQEVKQLCVRTCLARNVKLADHTDMTLEQLRERANAVSGGQGSVATAKARRELLEVYGLFASEYEYLPLANSAVSGLQEPSTGHRPLDTAHSIPYLDFALGFARDHTNRLVHSYGAIQCLEKLLDLVVDDGFILINDYGQAEVKRDEDFEHQRFSLATFVGVNFPLLEAYFRRVRGHAADTAEAADGGATHPTADDVGGMLSRPELQGPGASSSRRESMARGDDEVGRIVYPSVPCDAETGRIDNPAYAGAAPLIYAPFGGDSGGIHSRLLSRAAPRETVLRFQACFGRAEYDRIHAPLNKAREAMKVGRFEMAATLYRDALKRQPHNWVLLSEISNFLTFSLRDPKAGADMAKLAIKLNPACSSDLWCTLGDALFEWGRTAEPRSAYQKALAINPSDVRARFNLAFVHTRAKNYRAALAMIADALALDKTGQYRERLLQKQAEVLQMVTLKNQQEFLLMVNLVSKPGDEIRNPNVEIRNKSETRNPNH